MSKTKARETEPVKRTLTILSPFRKPKGYDDIPFEETGRKHAERLREFQASLYPVKKVPKIFTYGYRMVKYKSAFVLTYHFPHPTRPDTVYEWKGHHYPRVYYGRVVLTKTFRRLLLREVKKLTPETRSIERVFARHQEKAREKGKRW